MAECANPVVQDLPSSARLAAQVAGLDVFLEDAALGFHWDVLDRLESGVYLLDPERRIMYWSVAAERITGYSAADVLAHSCADNILKHVDDQGRCLCADACPLAQVMMDGQPRAAEVFLHHKDGHRVPVRVYGAPIRDGHGHIIGAFETFSEATARLADLQRIRQLEEVAFLDALTGVANRRYLDSALAARLAELRRDGRRFGTIMIDIDHFKRFNDEHGHETGDRVLQMVAATLAHNCREFDLVGRWGGEEFVVLTGDDGSDAVLRLADRLRALVAQSDFVADGQSLHVTISAGVTATRPDDDAARILERADQLLYRSKADGRNRVTFER